MSNNRIIPSPRIFIAVGLSVFVFVSFLLYASVDTNAKLRQDIYSDAQLSNIATLKQKIEILERQLSKNNEIITNLDKKLNEENEKAQKIDWKFKEDGQKNNGLGHIPLPKDEKSQQVENKQQIPLPKAENSQQKDAALQKPVTFTTDASTCAAKNAKTDVQMLDAYVQLPFDNLDGGVWKQGFEIKYDKNKIQQEKRLEVVVIPHSHCDPGWLKTFEEYFDSQTRQILNGMLEHLEKKPDLKFIYAEMSFFELWWSRLKEEDREKTRNFLKSGQLEIVTGGWVMTDEANAHSFSIVMELIEGHEFLKNQMDYQPKSHWSIDPFGLSSTLAKLVQSSNFTHMAVQRVHYSVKKFLAETKQLEFRWRQLYANDNKATDIRTHMMPFYSYDVPHTCGPDPSVCCQFDFRRLVSIGCPWGKRPQRITDKNVAARAEMLADQYRKKAQLYRMNTVLIPLGDDFRYDSNIEWEEQYTNYKQLFEYMNNKPELNINARFGTLKDYFDLLDKRLAEETDESKKDLPILSGDFFTYADRDDHYWSGYFTSRPFYKHMDRTVQHFVRTADLLYSLALWKSKDSALPLDDSYYNLLVQSRRSLSLFQHHDGMTGTSRDYVVLDYGKKMLAAINNCSQIINQAAGYLLGINESKLISDQEFYLDELPKQLVIETGSSIILHNSLGFEREEVVCLSVKSPKVQITSGSQTIQQQIQPKIDLRNGIFTVLKDEFELCFAAKIPALGFERYQLVESGDSKHLATIQMSGNLNTKLTDEATIFKSGDPISLSNQFLQTSFDPSSGYLKSVQYTGEREIDLKMQFLHYGARPKDLSKSGDSMSGAYLFLPDGPAKSLEDDKNSFLIIKGAVRQSFLLKGPEEAFVFQKINLDFNSKALDIVNIVDVRSTSNFELSMRIQSEDLKTTNEQFYTDLNGFQVGKKVSGQL